MDTLDDEFVRGDEIREARIFGLEKRFAALDEIAFEGGLSVDESGNDIATEGVFEFEDHDIAWQDTCAVHGVAPDFEGEDSGASREMEGVEVDGEKALWFLVLIGGKACGDGAEDGDERVVRIGE